MLTVLAPALALVARNLHSFLPSFGGLSGITCTKTAVLAHPERLAVHIVVHSTAPLSHAVVV